MYFLQQAIAALGDDAGFRLINELRLPNRYFLARFLPEMNHGDFVIDASAMVIRATMAQPTAQDAPYAIGGATTMVSWLSRAAKLTQSIGFSENTQIQLRQLIDRGGAGSEEAVQNEVLSFLENVVVQAQWDSSEYLRGQALATGMLNWNHNGVKIDVDYGVPDSHKLPQRSGASAYHGENSKFWDDIRSTQKLLKGNVAYYVAHHNTVISILDNPANRASVVEGGVTLGYYTIVRLKGDNDTPSLDIRDRVTIWLYSEEGEIIDPSNPSSTKKVSFFRTGVVTAIGGGGRSGYRVGAGSAPDAAEWSALGYSHIAPTVESGFRMGRWARVYSPEDKPYQVKADSVSNFLPVVENPNLLVLMRTDMPE